MAGSTEPPGMPETMAALRITEWGGALEAVDAPVPEPGPTDVLVEVEATSVGLTVANAINGDLGDDPANLPRIPAHEVVGRVAERGRGVDHLEVGDLVAAYFYLACDACDACLRGREPLCADLAGYVGIDIDGGFAEYARLPAANALALPDGIDPVEATVVPDAVATPYHVAADRAAIEPGDHVMVLGAGGGVGIHLVQMAQHFGATVTAVDRAADKLAECARLGAAHAVDATETDVVDYAGSEGLRYDAIVDFTGAMDLLESVLPLLTERGRFVNLTTFPGDRLPVSPRDQVFAETEVVGSRYCGKYELVRAAELVADGTIEPVISEVATLREVPALLDRIRSGELVGRGAMRP